MNEYQKKSFLSRRHALAKFAEWPFSLLSYASSDQASHEDVEELLEQCTQGIASCWKMSKGRDLFVAAQTLSIYLQCLEGMGQIPLSYQCKRAHLASQGYQLAGILASHQGDLATRERYCRRGVYWAKVAGDPSLVVTALTKLGVAFHYKEQTKSSLYIYQEALLFVHQVSPLCQSSLYMKIAEAYARLGQGREAEQCLDWAYQSFPAHIEADPTFPYADCDIPSLFLWDGMTHLALVRSEVQSHADMEHLKLAWQAFELFGGRQPARVISERNRLEILNRQAETAVYLHRQDLFTTCLMEAIAGAKALGSEKRLNEAVSVYWKARAAWPHDARIKELAELLI